MNWRYSLFPAASSSWIFVLYQLSYCQISKSSNPALSSSFTRGSGAWNSFQIEKLLRCSSHGAIVIECVKSETYLGGRIDSINPWQSLKIVTTLDSNRGVGSKSLNETSMKSLQVSCLNRPQKKHPHVFCASSWWCKYGFSITILAISPYIPELHKA